MTPRPSDDPPGLGLPATSANGYYAITIDAADAAGYTATAAAVAGTTQAADGTTGTFTASRIGPPVPVDAGRD